MEALYLESVSVSWASLLTLLCDQTHYFPAPAGIVSSQIWANELQMYLYQDNNMSGVQNGMLWSAQKNNVIKLLFTERKLALLSRWHF